MTIYVGSLAGKYYIWSDVVGEVWRMSSAIGIGADDFEISRQSAETAVGLGAIQAPESDVEGILLRRKAMDIVGQIGCLQNALGSILLRMSSKCVLPSPQEQELIDSKLRW